MTVYEWYVVEALTETETETAIPLAKAVTVPTVVVLGILASTADMCHVTSALALTWLFPTGSAREGDTWRAHEA